ncbi:unnamed protein product [Rotaria magnacalcarata]|uniref:HECT-type E3 ubiquitin transferase n=1 Tax=Rotaria magnacalcarata TaxID=392030 RepID=A0A8S2NYM7_9BILA|nr:unnamed protein product [Rotaria magnacalcarata]
MSREKIYGVDASERNTRLLRVKVLRAIDLQRRDFLGGTGDPYVKITLQIVENRNSVIDFARTHTVPKTLNPVWNQDFLFRVDPTKHRLVFEIFDHNKLVNGFCKTKHEFLGMFSIDLHANIPYESAERLFPIKDYSLLKRSVLQRVRGTASIGLAYISTNATSTTTESTEEEEEEDSQQNDSDFEIITHRDIPESLASSTTQPLPPGWEERQDALGRTYYVDHNTRTTTWTRPNGQANPSSQRSQPQVGDRHQIDDVDSNNTETTIITSRDADVAATTTGTAVTTDVSIVDELGRLAPNWQMFTADNGRVFYIDHVNKRTTWIDPRTGKPTLLPAVQTELSQNGPLPVCKLGNSNIN